MKPYLWYLAVALSAISVSLWQQATSSSAPDAALPHVELVEKSPNRYLGAGSCAAAACHNGYSTKLHDRREYTTWITQKDPHAKAYEILHNDASKRIQKYLNAKTEAFNDQRCLSCHVAQDYDEKLLSAEAEYFKTDGVSCESCHGPAKNWINDHHLESWKHKTAAEKHHQGLNDTQSLLGRARVCVSCHVGTAGKDVDHDLIAAGHPRLNFEFSAFHAALPHHWPDAKDRDPTQPQRGGPDFEARAWAIGQLVTAEASLNLLADRADPAITKVWPEFTEHDCAACHHDLHSNSPRQSKENFGSRKPGSLPWGNYVTMADFAIKSIDAGGDKTLDGHIKAIQTTFATGKPNRKLIVANAKAAAKSLNLWQHKLAGTPYDRMAVTKLLDSLYAKRPAKVLAPTDELAQLHLGMAALSMAARDLKLMVPPNGLSYPFERFEPDAFSKRMKASRAP